MSERADDESIRLRRAYDPPLADDGYRVLVDRVWPRGVRREALALDEWCKDVAPSTELRKWFGHVPERFAEFRTRYLAELERSPDIDRLATRSGAGRLTLVYSARDTEHNQAVVLREAIAARA